MTNRQIIDLLPGQLITRYKRVRLNNIWQVEAQIENDQYALRVVSPTEFEVRSDTMPNFNRTPWRTPPDRQRYLLTWRALRDFRRIA